MSLEGFPNLYEERMKIQKLKFDNLQDLKLILETDNHTFYDNIPFMQHNFNKIKMFLKAYNDPFYFKTLATQLHF